MPTRRQLIQQVSLNTGASSITFSNIPQNFTDLKLVISARSGRAAGLFVDSLYLQFNGVTTGYTNRTLYINNGGAILSAGASDGMFAVASISSSDATANTYGSGEVYIANYSSSTLLKSINGTGTAEANSVNYYMGVTTGLWSSTNPISSMVLSTATGSNFLTGSTAYLYGITHIPIINGGEVSIRGGFKYHTFRSTGTLQVVEPGDVEYLVVAGGGGGGAVQGGGGGAGGMLVGRTRLGTGVQSVSIGAGGTGAVGGGSGADRADSGSNSSAFSITSTGGGGGGSYNPPGGTAIVGRNGGSGGGGGSYFGANPAPGAGGSGTSGQGNNGGQGNSDNSTYRSGGGGGGAGAAGSAISNSSSFGHGGIGLQWPSGSGTYYAGGGGGGSGANAGNGGAGGGGTGSVSSGSVNPGVANTGGGGGSSGNFNINGGNGGSGIVIIRYPYDGN